MKILTMEKSTAFYRALMMKGCSILFHACAPFQNDAASAVETDGLELIVEERVGVVVVDAFVFVAAFFAVAGGDGDGFCQVDQVKELHGAHELVGVCAGDVAQGIGFEVVEVFDAGAHHVFAAQFETDVVIHDDLQGGVGFEPVGAVLAIHEAVVEIDVFLDGWMAGDIVCVDGLHVFGHRFPGDVAPDRGIGDAAADVADDVACGKNARHVGGCVEVDLNAALLERIVVGAELNHAFVQIDAALLKVIGDGIDAFAQKLLVLVNVVFFAVAGAVHKSWAGGAFEALGENAGVDVHEGVAAFAVWLVAERADGVAVDVADHAEPGGFATARKPFDAAVAVWHIDVDEFGAGTISNGGTTSSCRTTVDIENIGRVDVRIHAHGLSGGHEHSLGLDDDDFRLVVGQHETNGANGAPFVVGEDVADVELVHDLGAVFAGLVGQHAFLIGAVVFEMVALAGWHGVPFEAIGAGWLHVDTPLLPAFDDALCAPHHFLGHGWVLPWAAFHAFADFGDDAVEIVAVAFRDVAHEMVVAAAAVARASGVGFFGDQHVHAFAGCGDRGLQPSHPAADDEVVCFYDFVTNFHVHHSAPPCCVRFSSGTSMVNII